MTAIKTVKNLRIYSTTVLTCLLLILPISVKPQTLRSSPAISYENGIAMTTFITVSFKETIIDVPQGEAASPIEDIYPEHVNIKNTLAEYGKETLLRKVLPDFMPADTLWINKRGELVRRNDWSKVYPWVESEGHPNDFDPSEMMFLNENLGWVLSFQGRIWKYNGPQD